MALVPGGYQGGLGSSQVGLGDLFGWMQNHPQGQTPGFSMQNTPYAQQMLDLMRKYDPNASIMGTGQFDPNSGEQLSQFNFDASKLPAMDPNHTAAQGWASALNPQQAMGAHQEGNIAQNAPLYKSYNQGDWFNDPNYGWLTKQSNVAPYMGDKNFGTDVIGPMIASAAMGVMGGGLGGALFGNGGGLGSILGRAAAKTGMGLLGQGLMAQGNGTPFKINPAQLAMSIGMGSLPGVLQSAGGGAGQLGQLLSNPFVRAGGNLIGSLATRRGR